MLKYNLRNKSKLTKFATVALGLLLLVGVAYGGFSVYRHYHPTSLTTPDGQKVKLKPATKEEKQQAEDHKTDIVEQEAARNAAAASQKATASSVVITTASSTGVRAYVTGVFEENGTCTATATQNGQTVTKTSTGFQNVSYTQCAPIDWNAPLGPGTWTINLTYSSAATNSSQSTTIEVK
jgi:cytoskeletal protein RodZ